MAKQFIFDKKQQTIHLSGDLTFDTIAVMRRALLRVLEQSIGELTLDLSGVSFSNSAGLVLLLECRRQLLKKKRHYHFKAIPTQVLAIAEIAGILPLLKEPECPQT